MHHGAEPWYKLIGNVPSRCIFRSGWGSSRYARGGLVPCNAAGSGIAPRFLVPAGWSPTLPLADMDWKDSALYIT
jgi:hypothetical protein